MQRDAARSILANPRRHRSERRSHGMRERRDGCVRLEDHLLMPRRHKLSLLLLLAGSVAQASQSLSAGSGSGTFPNSAPFTNLSSFRIEFRVHGPWTVSTIQ